MLSVLTNPHLWVWVAHCFFDIMRRELLTERIMNNDSGDLSRTLSNPYSERVTLREIVGRTTAVIGSVAAVYGAVEIARHYHLAEYLRRFF